MGLMDWLNSFLGKKEENDIKLEPDGVKEFENNEDVKEAVEPVKEEAKPDEEVVIEDVKPVRAAKKAKSKSKKKGKK